jgi:hypothetical protein
MLRYYVTLGEALYIKATIDLTQRSPYDRLYTIAFFPSRGCRIRDWRDVQDLALFHRIGEADEMCAALTEACQSGYSFLTHEIKTRGWRVHTIDTKAPTGPFKGHADGRPTYNQAGV